jgi:hypothetical protein
MIRPARRFVHRLTCYAGHDDGSLESGGAAGY